MDKIIPVMSNEQPHNKDRVSRSAKALPGDDEAATPAGFARGSAVLKEQLKTMPESPGVYRMISAKGEVLYVGKARSLKKRVSNYTSMERLPLRLQRMVALVTNLEITTTHTESEALLLEANLIRSLQPPFNVLLRDDKSYPYILITRDHDFPQIVKYRGSKDRDGWYFGPFASADAVTETMHILMRGFMLRNCTDSVFEARKRPCLQYHIKRCTAPCVGLASKDAYATQVKDARAFLTGRNDTLLELLQNQMNLASAEKNYEEAAQIRDRIRVLAAVQAKQSINVDGIGDADVIALARVGGQTCIQVFFIRSDRNYGNRATFPQHDHDLSEAEIMGSFLAQFYADKIPPHDIYLSHTPQDEDLLREAFSEKNKTKITFHVPKLGDKRRIMDMALQNAEEALARRHAERKSQNVLLEGVARAFGLESPPTRIEVYDNSHVSGTFAVGGMIVATAEGFHKKAYRKFNIKDAALSPGDDYGMMREVLKRRFTRELAENPDRKKESWPDLILVDGGRGQLNAALEVMDELNLDDVTVVGIAKGPDRNAGRERFFMKNREEFGMPPQDPVLYYLQRLRDEAHRFAIGTHRARRAKAIVTSPLDEVPGIGPARKKALLMHFGSARAVSRAGLDDLKRVPGISEDLAKKIYDFFHGG